MPRHLLQNVAFVAPRLLQLGALSASWLRRAQVTALDPTFSAIAAMQRPAPYLSVDGGIVRLLRDALRAQTGLYRAALCGASPAALCRIRHQ